MDTLGANDARSATPAVKEYRMVDGYVLDRFGTRRWCLYCAVLILYALYIGWSRRTPAGVGLRLTSITSEVFSTESIHCHSKQSSIRQSTLIVWGNSKQLHRQEVSEDSLRAAWIPDRESSRHHHPASRRVGNSSNERARF